MRFGKLHFGSITIDGVTYTHDVVIDCGKVGKRKKKRSKQFRGQFGHTPISLKEKVPWECRRLIIGTGNYGSLPVMDEVKHDAHRRKVQLLIIPTDEAINALTKEPEHTNAILHITC